MAKHKGKIIAGLVVLALLVVAFVWDGALPQAGAGSPSGVQQEAGQTAAPPTLPTGAGQDAAATEEGSTAPDAGAADPTTAEDAQASGRQPEQTPDQVPQPDDPAQAGQPTAPAEPADATYTCTLSVQCTTVFNNSSLLAAEKLALLPADGVIFPATTVTFYEGESVFNVLQREMKNAAIAMEFVNTPLYNSAYIEGIANLYELDCGALSGWTYQVNSWFPNYGCSSYQLQDGDSIVWLYTCDLGQDVGGYFEDGLQGGKE